MNLIAGRLLVVAGGDRFVIRDVEGGEDVFVPAVKVGDG